MIDRKWENSKWVWPKPKPQRAAACSCVARLYKAGLWETGDAPDPDGLGKYKMHNKQFQDST